MNTLWLDHLLLKSSEQLASSAATSARFTETIRDHLKRRPIQAWEADRWARGLKHRMIRLEGYFCRVGTGKRSALSLFVRNEAGLYVGLRRETLTQAATYVSLITDFGYQREQTYFESRWMDVAVEKENGELLIYAENKAAERTLIKLCDRLCAQYIDGLPTVPDDAPLEDALMKAQHIWKNRPDYFWGVSPTHRQAYRVVYNPQGFSLTPIGKIPSTLEWDSFPTD